MSGLRGGTIVMTKLTQKESKTTTFVLKKEHAKIIHQLVCDQMDDIFLFLDNQEDWVASEEQQLILDAVREYSAQLPYGCFRDE